MANKTPPKIGSHSRYKLPIDLALATENCL